MRAVSVLCLGACAYHPGSFSQYGNSFVGQRVTVGCLDLGIARRINRDPNTAVVAYEFGNRCPGPAIVDLARANVIGRTVDGQEVALAPYDPKQEVRALQIDGRMMGKEALAYPSEVAVVQICVDAASIAHREGAQWICFGGDHL
jgi:hypothetical protein